MTWVKQVNLYIFTNEGITCIIKMLKYNLMFIIILKVLLKNMKINKSRYGKEKWLIVKTK